MQLFFFFLTATTFTYPLLNIAGVGKPGMNIFLHNPVSAFIYTVEGADAVVFHSSFASFRPKPAYSQLSSLAHWTQLHLSFESLEPYLPLYISRFTTEAAPRVLTGLNPKAQ